MKMSESEFLQLFAGVFTPFFQTCGFAWSGNLLFTRNRECIEQRVVFAVSAASSGVLRLTCGVGIRIPVIEKIIRPEREGANLPTVGMPLHLLKPDNDYRPWVFSHKDEFLALETKIRADVTTYIVPFFERYSSVAAVYTALESEVPRDWFMSTSDHRDSLLVAKAMLDQGKTAALALGERLLSAYAGKLPKYSMTLRDLLCRIRNEQPEPS